MDKVIVTEEQYKALNTMLRHESEISCIKNFIEESHLWNAIFMPLKELGLEQFTKAVLYGYERKIKVPKYIKNNDIILSFTQESIESIRNTSTIMITSNRNRVSHYNIEEAKFVSESLSKLITFYENNVI